MHSLSTAETRIDQLLKGKDHFMEFSRKLAEQAQLREIVTRQPKERLSGNEASIAIKNCLGGYYFFTVDAGFRNALFLFSIVVMNQPFPITRITRATFKL